jgi:hypothetical protein
MRIPHCQSTAKSFAHSSTTVKSLGATAFVSKKLVADATVFFTCFLYKTQQNGPQLINFFRARSYPGQDSYTIVVFHASFLIANFVQKQEPGLTPLSFPMGPRP